MSSDFNFDELFEELHKKRQKKFIEAFTANQALLNLQGQVYNLVNTYREIIIDHYLLTSDRLEESEAYDLSLSIDTLQDDFYNVVRAMFSVFKKLKTEKVNNGTSFKVFIDKQSSEVLSLYNDSITEALSDDLAKLLNDMYFMFDMCFRAINTELQVYNVENTPKLPLVNTFKLPKTFDAKIDFAKTIVDVEKSGEKLFEDMKNLCNI